VKTVTDALGVARSHLATRTASKPPPQRQGRRPQPEDALLAEIKTLIAGQPTYGYRRINALLRRQRCEQGGSAVNVKRVYRVMKVHGLLLERHTGKGEERRHGGQVAVDRPDTRWCSDGFEIGCDNGERVRIAFTLDCCDREAISWVATTGGIDSGDIRDLMIESVERRFGLIDKLPAPIEWLSDNGSPYTARETRSFARGIGLVPGQRRSKVRSRTVWPRLSSKPSSAITSASIIARMRTACCAGSTLGSIITMAFIRTKRWATARRVNSGNNWWRRRPRTRSARCVDRMMALRPRR
jgi:putative transposase